MGNVFAVQANCETKRAAAKTAKKAADTEEALSGSIA